MLNLGLMKIRLVSASDPGVVLIKLKHKRSNIKFELPNLSFLWSLNFVI
jgi:hypothetical protein